MTSRLCALALLGIFAPQPIPALAPAREISARLTQIEGAVEISNSGVRGLPAASAWQVLRQGATLRVPARGFAGLVCSDRRYVRLVGEQSWTLSPERCAAGRLLSEAQYALVEPRAGRFSVVAGMMVVDRELRFIRGENPLAPVAFTLRSGLLRSLRPTVSWLAADGADAYLLEWQREGITEHRFRISAADASCHRETDGLALCTFPWPAEAPDLAPGTEYVLNLSACGSVSSAWLANAPTELKTPRLDDITRLESALADLEDLDLQGDTLLTAKAGLFASLGIYSEAVRIYRQLRANDRSPELGVTLADLYLVTGLDNLAEPLYRETLSGKAAAVRAASAFGLGRISYERQSFPKAAKFFKRARSLYEKSGLGNEAEAAKQAAQEATERSEPDERRREPRVKA